MGQVKISLIEPNYWLHDEQGQGSNERGGKNRMAFQCWLKTL